MTPAWVWLVLAAVLVEISVQQFPDMFELSTENTGSTPATSTDDEYQVTSEAYLMHETDSSSESPLTTASLVPPLITTTTSNDDRNSTAPSNSSMLTTTPLPTHHTASASTPRKDQGVHASTSSMVKSNTPNPVEYDFLKDSSLDFKLEDKEFFMFDNFLTVFRPYPQKAKGPDEFYLPLFEKDVEMLFNEKVQHTEDISPSTQVYTSLNDSHSNTLGNATDMKM